MRFFIKKHRVYVYTNINLNLDNNVTWNNMNKDICENFSLATLCSIVTTIKVMKKVIIYLYC